MNLYGMIQSKYEPNTSTLQLLQSCCRTTKHIAKDIKYIPEGAIWEDYHTIPENNLLQYPKTYSNEVDNAKETYVIGTSKDGGTFSGRSTRAYKQKQKYPTIMKTKKGTINLKYPIKIKKGIALAFMESTSMTI
jgi:hypothetical protein